ncbi:MAG: ArnT family glycosyltransferase [Bacteroidota bacterium]
MFSRVSLFIGILCLAAVFSSFYVCDRIYEQIPHTEDEISYRWQARVFAEGKYFIPSPPHAANTFVPFVIDYEGRRFSKYPPGWPLILSLGVRAGLDTWVNPLLAGLCVLLAYLLGKRLVSEAAGLIAAALMVTSPFFLLNSGSFLSSNLSLALTGVFALAWLEAFSQPVPRFPILYAILAGTSLGWLALTRPLTALGVALPFGIHGLVLLWREDWTVRRRVLLVGGLAAILAGLLPVWQYLVTGQPFLDPYALWWPFDRLGFGKGHGISPQGYTWQDAGENMEIMLNASRRDVFGWGNYSWILLPFGVWVLRKKKVAWSVIAIFVSLVLTYTLYWAHVTRYGPRYYYEGLYSLTILSAAGILWLAGKNRFRIAFATLLMGGLIGYNLFVYLPARLDSARAIYGITGSQLALFQAQSAQELVPALVFVPLSNKTVYGNLYGDWPQYGGLLELENPDLTSPFIFAVQRGEAENNALIQAYPGRRVIYYDPGGVAKLQEKPGN